MKNQTSGANLNRPDPAAAFEIPVDQIEADPQQPRTAFDSGPLERLARSLTDHGQLQPIVVRPGSAPGRYVIVSGERRWRASVLAGKVSITAQVLNILPGDPRILELQLVENALREDVGPLDQARAYRALMDRNQWSAREVSRNLNLDPSTVARSVRLLTLPDPLREAVETRWLAPSIAHEIARVADPEARDALTARALVEGLSRLAVVAIIRGETVSPAAPVAVPTRVFQTSVGRLSVELDRDLGFYGIMDAVTQVAQVLSAEIRARRASGNDGP